jgi:hypothetical protein
VAVDEVMALTKFHQTTKGESQEATDDNAEDDLIYTSSAL